MTQAAPIVFLNSFPGDSIGGGEVQLLSLVSGLMERGEDVVVAAAEGSRMLEAARAIEGLDVYPVDFRAGSPTGIALSIARDIPHAAIVVGTGFFANVVARQLGVAIKSRIVNIAHVVPGANRLQGEKWISRLARWALDTNTRRFVDRWVAVSDAAAQGLIADKVRADKVVTIANGIDVDEVRRRAGARLEHEDVRIGFVGRLEHIKAPDLFVELAVRIPEATFVVGGSGSLADDLAVRAEALGVSDRVELLGFVDEVAPVLASFDVLVVPSRSESAPMAILEAQALGVPVVATDVGGIPELVLDGKTGLLVPGEDVEALEGAVRRILSDAGLRARLVTDAAARVELEFTRGRMIARYAELFDELR